MTMIPKAFQPFVSTGVPDGLITDICVRPARGADPIRVASWDVTGAADYGKRTGKRAVTLIQAEHIDVISAFLQRPIAWHTLRRNVLVKGLNLNILYGKRFRVGEVVLEGTIDCAPCDQMHALLGPGGFAALVGHGGLCARLITPGTLRVGDPITILGDALVP